MSRLILLGENIKKYRDKKGWSQQVLADHLVLTREYISRIESGQKYVSMRKIFEIADLLNAPVKDLFDFD